MNSNKLLLFLLSLTILLCCFTACTESSSKNSPQESKKIEQNESEKLTETAVPNVIDAIAGSRETSTGDIFTYSIPKIVLSGAEIDALNDEIYRRFYTDNISEDGVFYGAITDYDWYVSGDILTLVIRKDFALEFLEYGIYSVRISDAHVMTSQEVISEAGLTVDEFGEQVRAVLGNAYCVWLNDYISQQLNSDEDRILEQFEKTISKDNVASVMPFFNENKALCFLGSIYQISGASYHEEILPLIDYEVSEYYGILLSKLNREGF